MPSGAERDATIYVILGSHPCRTGMLMLEHKGIPYRRVTLPTGLHPYLVRALGFPGHTDRMLDGNRTTPSLSLASRLGTVPALRIGGENVQTNRAIARHLDRIKPEPALFPADTELCRRVEEAEEWGDQALQMVARRLLVAYAFSADADPHLGDDGRLGPLLVRNHLVRGLGARAIGRLTFNATARTEGELLAELPAMLDRVDAWIHAGVLNAAQLNAADYMIVTSLALLTYRDDIRPALEERPLIELVDRVLPEPA